MKDVFFFMKPDPQHSDSSNGLPPQGTRGTRMGTPVPVQVGSL